jgi:hypothetical protein
MLKTILGGIVGNLSVGYFIAWPLFSSGMRCGICNQTKFRAFFMGILALDTSKCRLRHDQLDKNSMGM